MGVSQGNDSLALQVKNYLKEKYNKPGNVYLGIVSRLDSHASGVMVFARTSKAAARLNRQFVVRSVKKTYLAIVGGSLPVDQGELRNWVIKNERHRCMAVVEDKHPDSQFALLRFETAGKARDTTLLRVDLVSGRKHQIRLQMAAAGHPIVGDRKYGSRLPFPRGIALHCQSLAFDHPTQGQRLVFECPPPEYWQLREFQLS
jgi:23S rRNA pseudouridine1911/1915/1917 synthase